MENARHHARVDAKSIPVQDPDLMAVGHSRRRGCWDESSYGKRSFRFIAGPGVRAAPDGRRNQPRSAAHPVGVLSHARNSTSPLRRGGHDLPSIPCAGAQPWSRKAPTGCRKRSIDRFLRRSTFDYPRSRAERSMLFEPTARRGGTTAKAIMNAKNADHGDNGWCGGCRSATSVVEAIRRWGRRASQSGGEGDKLSPGDGPAGQKVADGWRSAPVALLDGRLTASIDDCVDLAEPVLKHRHGR